MADADKAPPRKVEIEVVSGFIRLIPHDAKPGTGRFSWFCGWVLNHGRVEFKGVLAPLPTTAEWVAIAREFHDRFGAEWVDSEQSDGVNAPFIRSHSLRRFDRK